MRKARILPSYVPHQKGNVATFKSDIVYVKQWMPFGKYEVLDTASSTGGFIAPEHLEFLDTEDEPDKGV